MWMNNPSYSGKTNSEVIIVKKNQFTRMLQNKTVLAALLIVLMAGTAVAGIMAVRRSDSGDGGDGQSGYAFETQDDSGNEQLAVPSQPETEEETEEETRREQLRETEEENKGKPVQSGDVDAVLENENEDALGTLTDEMDEDADGLLVETLVDAGDAVVYEPETEADDQAVDAAGTALNFQAGSTISWPVEGNVILDYSMDSTIYFPTLAQYKCNPGILIQSEVGTPVEAAARGMVTAIGSNEELGNFVQMDLGGDYSVIYGQLTDVTVSLDQVVETGEVLGYVAEPTKYYVVEGPNMYLELRYQGNPVDPLDYIR